MSHKSTALAKQAEIIIKNLEKRNMEGFYFDTASECTRAILETIPDGSVISWGGSESIKESGLMDGIHNGNYKLIDRSTATSPEESRRLYAQAVLADYYLMSSNAITLSGELINIDGNGNRVACLIQGPSHVILVVGMNKVVTDIESGIARVRNMASPPKLLKQLNRHTNAQHLYGRMCSGHLQGRILKMLTSMIKPKHILELGTFTGYSALCFAEGIGNDCHVDTIEIDDEVAEVAREWFDKSSDSHKITIHIGDAMTIIPTLPDDYDLVFIDANKRIYTEYLETAYPKLKTGGYIFADNTLWDGKVLDPDALDPQTSGIKKFNDSLTTDPRFETVILPLRDGLTILRKL